MAALIVTEFVGGIYICRFCNFKHCWSCSKNYSVFHSDQPIPIFCLFPFLFSITLDLVHLSFLYIFIYFLEFVFQCCPYFCLGFVSICPYLVILFYYWFSKYFVLLPASFMGGRSWLFYQDAIFHFFYTLLM